MECEIEEYMIQLIRTSDYREIYNCMKQCADDIYNQRLNNENDITELARKYAARGCFVMALEDGSVSGMAAFYCNDHINRLGFLSRIVVRRKYQHKGIGTKLLSHVCAECKACKMIKLRLEVDSTNKSAQKFYEKYGFVKESQEDRSIFMMKDL